MIPPKDRKAFFTYVVLKGYKNGENQWGCQYGMFSLDEIAKELNMSKRNLQRALRIERNLTDSMKELLDTGAAFLKFARIYLHNRTKRENFMSITAIELKQNL